MQPHTFLSILQTHFHSARANNILSNSRIKNCWKHWLSAELTLAFGQHFQPEGIGVDVIYPAKSGEDKLSYLGYKPKDNCAEVVEKRGASKCDFAFQSEKESIFFEVRCGHHDTFLNNQELKKFIADLNRVKALKVANPTLNIVVIFAVYGRFDNHEMHKFKALDNSELCAYVWDSGLVGSSSIARLSHMRRGGEPRVFFIAYQF